MEYDRQNLLSFKSIFCPSTPLTTWKMKILKKMKKKKMTGDIITLYMCTINENHMMHVMYGS